MIDRLFQVVDMVHNGVRMARDGAELVRDAISEQMTGKGYRRHVQDVLDLAMAQAQDALDQVGRLEAMLEALQAEHGELVVRSMQLKRELAAACGAHRTAANAYQAEQAVNVTLTAAVLNMRATMAPLLEGRPGLTAASGDGNVSISLTVAEWERLTALRNQ